MPNSHPKYKVREGDTIPIITERFGVKEIVWINYHNNECRMFHEIGKKIPNRVKEIYLLPELWEKADALNAMPNTKEIEGKRIDQRIEFGFENTLPMKACYEPLHYGVMLALFNDEKVNTIKYEISVRWIGKEDKNHYIEINKISDTCINDQEPDLMFDILAVKAASALYPLQLIVTSSDGIVGINNVADIQKRWENTKQEIRKYYSSDVLEKYLRLNDKTLQSEETLLRSLRNDWFLHAYFNRIYQPYGREYSFTNHILAPFVFDSNGVEYTIQQTINPIIDEQGFVKIEMKGEFSDERSLIDLESGLNYPQYESANKPEGNYYAQYLIKSQHHTIDTLMIDCSLSLNNSKKTFIVISRINKQESWVKKR